MEGRRILVEGVAGFLVTSALLHLLVPRRVDVWLGLVAVVRTIGLSLLIVAVPCFVWRGWYFLTLGLLLTASGTWRLFFAANSIRAQRATYPRWVHGCLMLLGAWGVLALARLNGVL